MFLQVLMRGRFPSPSDLTHHDPLEKQGLFELKYRSNNGRRTFHSKAISKNGYVSAFLLNKPRTQRLKIEGKKTNYQSISGETRTLIALNGIGNRSKRLPQEPESDAKLSLSASPVNHEPFVTIYTRSVHYSHLQARDGAKYPQRRFRKCAQSFFVLKAKDVVNIVSSQSQQHKMQMRLKHQLDPLDEKVLERRAIPRNLMSSIKGLPPCSLRDPIFLKGPEKPISCRQLIKLLENHRLGLSRIKVSIDDVQLPPLSDSQKTKVQELKASFKLLDTQKDEELDEQYLTKKYPLCMRSTSGHSDKQYTLRKPVFYRDQLTPYSELHLTELISKKAVLQCEAEPCQKSDFKKPGNFNAEQQKIVEILQEAFRLIDEGKLTIPLSQHGFIDISLLERYVHHHWGKPKFITWDSSMLAQFKTAYDTPFVQRLLPCQSRIFDPKREAVEFNCESLTQADRAVTQRRSIPFQLMCKPIGEESCFTRFSLRDPVFVIWRKDPISLRLFKQLLESKAMYNGKLITTGDAVLPEDYTLGQKKAIKFLKDAFDMLDKQLDESLDDHLFSSLPRELYGAVLQRPYLSTKRYSLRHPIFVREHCSPISRCQQQEYLNKRVLLTEESRPCTESDFKQLEKELTPKQKEITEIIHQAFSLIDKGDYDEAKTLIKNRHLRELKGQKSALPNPSHPPQGLKLGTRRS